MSGVKMERKYVITYQKDGFETRAYPCGCIIEVLPDDRKYHAEWCKDCADKAQGRLP